MCGGSGVGEKSGNFLEISLIKHVEPCPSILGVSCG